MERTKKKPEAIKKKKGKVIGYIQVPGADELSESEVARQEAAFWDDTIQALSGQTFETLDDAIYAVVEAAMAKLDTSTESDEETKEFLYDVLNMDPEILDILKASLTIKTYDPS